jgi:hypothetical protein
LSTECDAYVTDVFNHRVRKIYARTCQINTIAGTGGQGYSGDNGPALQAKLSRPHAGALDTKGNFLFADLDYHVVRRVDVKTGMIETVAGIGKGKSHPPD